MPTDLQYHLYRRLDNDVASSMPSLNFEHRLYHRTSNIHLGKWDKSSTELARCSETPQLPPKIDYRQIRLEKPTGVFAPMPNLAVTYWSECKLQTRFNIRFREKQALFANRIDKGSIEQTYFYGQEFSIWLQIRVTINYVAACKQKCICMQINTLRPRQHDFPDNVFKGIF